MMRSKVGIWKQVVFKKNLHTYGGRVFGSSKLVVITREHRETRMVLVAGRAAGRRWIKEAIKLWMRGDQISYIYLHDQKNSCFWFWKCVTLEIFIYTHSFYFMYFLNWPFDLFLLLLMRKFNLLNSEPR